MLSALLFSIAVSFGDVSVQCAVDTGSAITVLSQSAVNRIASKAPAQGVVALQGVGGAPMTAKLVVVPRVSAGELDWADVAIAVLPDDSLGATRCLLGLDLLGRQPIVLDWGTRRVLPYRSSATSTPLSPLPVRTVTMAADEADAAAAADGDALSGAPVDAPTGDAPGVGGSAS